MRHVIPLSFTLSALAASGHSRAPVADGANLDHVVGIVHLRDMLDAGSTSMREVAAPMFALPAGARVLDALHELQVRRSQMALVVDEHGAAAGIITMEDLIEELVGEIYDETDRDVAMLHHFEDGSIALPGQFPVHDLGDLGIDDVEARQCEPALLQPEKSPRAPQTLRTDGEVRW